LDISPTVTHLMLFSGALQCH